MSIWRLTLKSRVSASFLVGWICLSCFPGFALSAVVTLDSIVIFTTHEFIFDPKVYFKCKEENKTELPDVKNANILYTFKGEESWQPLTEFTGKKCKRCGFYESDTIKSDDVFDEWELCPSDFASPGGKYTHSKEKEFNATFSCSKCLLLQGGEGSDPEHDSADDHDSGKKMHPAILTIVIIVSILMAALITVGIVKGVKVWRKKRRQQEQAQFLKLFEDGDDIEDELGLGHML